VVVYKLRTLGERRTLVAKVRNTKASAGRAPRKTPSRVNKKVAQEKPSRGSTTSKKAASVMAKKKGAKKATPRTNTTRVTKKASTKTSKSNKSAEAVGKKSGTKKGVNAGVAVGARRNSRPAATKAKKRTSLRKGAAKPNSNGRGEQSQSDAPRVKPAPKTHLRADELAEFKQLLLGRRAELAGDMHHLSNESSGKNSEAGADHSTMPIHMADLGSDNWEHEFTLGLIANEQVRIREIDEALARIENGTYGVCLGTHRRIRKARLRAKPWAKYCIEHARALEEGRA